MIELSEFDVQYRPRTVIKAQTLANFITEFTVKGGEEDEERKPEAWMIWIDGLSNQRAGGAGVQL